MKKFFIRITILLAVLLTGYFIWSLTGRATEKESGWSTNPDFKVRFEYTEQGADSGKGNLIGIQPYLTAVNYSTAYNFETSLRFYFEQLKREGKLNSKTVVVLPENIGTWLVLANEKESVYKAASLQEAFKSIRSASVFSYLNGWFKSPVTDKNSYAILQLKAAKMVLQYKQIFSALAKEYKCCIAAGSMLLPDAIIDASNTIQSKAGSKIYNTFFLFDTTGAIMQPVTKKEIKSTDLFAFDASSNLLVVSVEGQSISFTPTKSSTHFAKTAAARNYSYKKDETLSNIQQGMAVTFSGHLFNKQLIGYLELIQNNNVSILPPASGKGRIVCLWLK
jgi:predicted amidohydrolase